MHFFNDSHLFRKAALVVTAVSTLSVTGCMDDGDDGQAGAAGPAGEAGADGADGANGADGQDLTAAQTLPDLTTDNRLTRLASLPSGAEVTGIFLTDEGDLFFNAQHPDDSNSTADADGTVYNRATVGAIVDIPQNAESIPDMAAPATAEEQELIMTAVGSYQTIAQEGDTMAGSPKGGLGAILTEDDSASVKQSNDPDFNAFIPTGVGQGYLFTNWEDRPGGMSRMRVRKDDAGRWQVVGNSMEMLDFSGVHGTWVNCFGTASPWNTPLTAEENYASASTINWNNPDYNYIGGIEDLATALGNSGDFTQQPYPNPYRYGYIVEIVNPVDAPTPVKHFTTGRFAHENGVVMPDEKTVYLSDDGGYRPFFKFVADNAGDLSSGTLYAAKVTQNGTAPDQATFDVSWIEMGSSDNATLEAAIAEYDNIDQGDYTGTTSSYITDEQIGDWVEMKTGQDLSPDTWPDDGSTLAGRTFDNDANDGGSNGLPSAKPFVDDRVPFLHAREAAALLGATDEWEKFEGVNINLNRAMEALEGLDKVPNETVSDAYLYMAMSNFDAGMSDGQGDIDVQPDDAEACGAVYRAQLEPGYDISLIEPVVVGGPYDASAPDNTCNVDNISEPDNLVVMDDGRVIVGEDTNEHLNNFLWILQP